MLDAVEAQRNEKLAINAIQESLMQIETAVNPASNIVISSSTVAEQAATVSKQSNFISHLAPLLENQK